MCELVDAIFDKLIQLIGSPEIVVIILSVLPVSEARLAIPIAIKYAIHPLKAFLLGFIGSTATAAVLLAFLLPFIRYLSRTKLFKRIADALLKKAENNAEKIKGGFFKKMIGVGAFVALPLPLTGVWTGSLVAGILDLKYLKAFLSVVLGNFVAAAIVTVASVYFAEYINIMVAVFAGIALITVVILLIKAFVPFYKKANPKT